MKRIPINTADIYQIIGELTSIRVAADSRIKEINKLVSDDVAPFNNRFEKGKAPGKLEVWRNLTKI